jgi:hypothetical protein
VGAASRGLLLLGFFGADLQRRCNGDGSITRGGFFQGSLRGTAATDGKRSDKSLQQGSLGKTTQGARGLMTRVSSFAIPTSHSLAHKSIAISTLGRPPPTEGLQDQEMATTFAMPPTRGRDDLQTLFP